ncbi:MAG: UbiA family prenyltransferase [Planctomycetes bacterium]|nr:UbiA family prenyltransferase [Planctomycetota bacterium]
MNLVAWGRLLRLSLLPTAIADIAAGAVWAQGSFDFGRPELWLLIVASLCVYHGGMALNDWADRGEDARKRPDRPLASGAVASRHALAVGFGLLLLAPCLAYGADPVCGAIVLAVSAFAALYDLVGRGAWLGPLLLAACRAGNLGAGLRLGVSVGGPPGIAPATQLSSGDAELACFAPAALYGLYVFCVSRVGRLEDAEAPIGGRPRPWVFAASVLLLSAPCARWLARTALEGVGDDPVASDPYAPDLATVVARLLALALAFAAALRPLRRAWSTLEWTGALAMQTTGALLRRLLVFTGALALSSGTRDGAIVALAILCGYPLAFALRKVFPPS